LAAATRTMIEKTRNLVEPAGAAALAAVLAAPERFMGRTVAVVCSGGNISPAQLLSLWAHQLFGRLSLSWAGSGLYHHGHEPTVRRPRRSMADV
ncbi:MAG: hypothetical protein ACRDPY_30715, partial [Streptosporangiaceae bacterium]